MVGVTLVFKGVSKKELVTKLESAIEKYNLSAEYEDGKVTIMGPKEAIEQVRQAYVSRRMMADIMNNIF